MTRFLHLNFIQSMNTNVIVQVCMKWIFLPTLKGRNFYKKLIIFNQVGNVQDYIRF
jgi:hypothetical protein